MKNTISELKNTIEWIKWRLNEAEDWTNELKDKVEKKSQKEQEKEKTLQKNEVGIMETQNNMKRNNIHIIGPPEREEEQQGIEKPVWKSNDGKFP